MKHIIEISNMRYNDRNCGLFRHIPAREDSREFQIHYSRNKFITVYTGDIHRSVKHNRDVWENIFMFAYEMWKLRDNDGYNVYITASGWTSSELAVILEARRSWLDHIDEYQHRQPVLDMVNKLSRVWVPLRERLDEPRVYTRQDGTTVTVTNKFSRWICL